MVKKKTNREVKRHARRGKSLAKGHPRAGWDEAFRKAAKYNGPLQLTQEDKDWLNMPGTAIGDYAAYLKQFGQIIEGTPRQIAEKITAIRGKRRVSVLLIEDADRSTTWPALTNKEIERKMAELHALAESVPHSARNVDDSREAIYTRQEGE